ncbi:MAG: hypothetical protein JRC53_04420 [Deltaproteobacteria bacterium]|nr:hypothetical protein [Deltaproteobacteria bacterium]
MKKKRINIPPKNTKSIFYLSFLFPMRCNMPMRLYSVSIPVKPADPINCTKALKDTWKDTGIKIM